jgi:uncharacterized protein (DUF885 family)
MTDAVSPAAPEPRLRQIADDYWEAVMEASPSFATFVGDHRYDDRLDDLSEEAEVAHLTVITELERDAAALPPDALSPVDRVTRGLLLAEVDHTRIRVEHHLAELASDQMTGPHADLLQLAPQTAAADPDSAAMLVQRYRQADRYLDQAAERFRAGLARQRPPAAINIERSINQVDGYLASPIEADPFVALQAPQDWDGEQAWRDELRAATEEVIRPAFARYRTVLADELQPAARSDEEAGLCHVDGGDEVYAALVRLHTTTDLTPEELHGIGMEEITERLPAEYREIGSRALGTGDLAEIFERLRTDESLRYETGEQIMADAVTALDRARGAIVDWFGRLPTIDCLIAEIPEYLAADAPAAYYFPPAGDGSRPGTYYVNTHNPHEKSRSEAESIGYHEAIPGHHLQLALAAEMEDVPDFQRLGFGNTAYVEGWALYTERLADEMGLYTGDLDRIGMLTADAWRAGRLVVDTGLHALGWTRQQAIDFLVDHTPLDPGEVTVEIDRYIGMPGQALAYKAGQREIFRLRAEARDQLGDRFDIKGFHDAVLAHGSVTLPILGDLVEEWIRSCSGT